MKTQPVAFLLLILIVCMNSRSQTWRKTDFGTQSTINAIDIELQFYSPSIVRVLKSPES